MRAVVQRVSEATVTVAGETVGAMGEGLLALIGVGRNDDDESAAEMARKLVHLRVFEDDEGRMNRSLLDTGGTLGVVSQFSLFGDCRKGRRPGFAAAADPDHAEPLIAKLVDDAKGLGVAVTTGRFRTAMQVALVNQGPVTLLIDTEKSF